MRDDIYNSAGRLEQRKKTLTVFKNGRCAIELLDNMILIPSDSNFFIAERTKLVINSTNVIELLLGMLGHVHSFLNWKKSKPFLNKGSNVISVSIS